MKRLYRKTKLLVPAHIFSLKLRFFSSQNFTCHFTYKTLKLEHFHRWNGNVFTYEISNLQVKWTGSKFRVWNFGVRIMYFAYEVEPSHTNNNFTYEIFVSHMELKYFLYEILFSYAKLHVKFTLGLLWIPHISLPGSNTLLMFVFLRTLRCLCLQGSRQ